MRTAPKCYSTRQAVACRAANEIIRDDNLYTVVVNHIKSVPWDYGPPIDVAHRDGYPVVIYRRGIWWHYNTAEGIWF